MSEGLIREHVDAFNAGDLDRVMAGFTQDAVWATGADTFRGADELHALFAGAFASLRPTLAIRRVIAAGTVVAAELTETWAAPDGAERVAPIAGFYTLAGGRIQRATIYREGSADD